MNARPKSPATSQLWPPAPHAANAARDPYRPVFWEIEERELVTTAHIDENMGGGRVIAILNNPCQAYPEHFSIEADGFHNAPAYNPPAAYNPPPTNNAATLETLRRILSGVGAVMGSMPSHGGGGG